MKEKTTSAVTRAKGKTATMPASKSVNPTTAYKVLFSPKGGISKELSRMTQAAAKEISVAAYAFSSKYLGNALVSAMKRGVKVRLILDKDNAEKAYAIDEWLIENGIDVRFIKLKSGCMHHKFLIIDRARLVTGSYNFTNDSEFRNHEAAIFFDATVASPTSASGTTGKAATVVSASATGTKGKAASVISANSSVTGTTTTPDASVEAINAVVTAFTSEFERLWSLAAPISISGGKG